MNARIPNRAFAAVSAPSGSLDATGTSGSMSPPGGRSTSPRAPTARFKSILANNLDRRPSPKRSADDAPILHPTSAGRDYNWEFSSLTHPTLDRLDALGLHGMAKAFADIEVGGC